MIPVRSICPYCGLCIEIEGVGCGAEALPSARGAVYVHEGRCPYPTCGGSVFAVTERPLAAPAKLVSRQDVKRMRARWAFEAVAPLLFAWLGTFGVVALSLWTAVKGLVDAHGAAAVALVLGGPVMVVVSVCGFVGLAITTSEPRPRGPSEPDLLLRPMPRSYRMA